MNPARTILAVILPAVILAWLVIGARLTTAWSNSNNITANDHSGCASRHLHVVVCTACTPVAPGSMMLPVDPSSRQIGELLSSGVLAILLVKHLILWHHSAFRTRRRSDRDSCISCTGGAILPEAWLGQDTLPLATQPLGVLIDCHAFNMIVLVLSEGRALELSACRARAELD